MNLYKIIAIFAVVFFGQNAFGQKDANKIITSQYEISFDKSLFDYHDLKEKGFVIFYKNIGDTGFTDCIRLTVEKAHKYKSMDLDYYASIISSLRADDYTITENKKINSPGQTPYYLLIYEKTLAGIKIKAQERIYFRNHLGFKLRFVTVARLHDQLRPDAEKILDSFKLLD